MVTLWLSGLICLAAAVRISLGEEVPTVQATETNVVAPQAAMETATEPERRKLPSLADVPPRPMPQFIPAYEAMQAGGDRFLLHDADSGETTEIDLPDQWSAEAAAGGFGGGYEGPNAVGSEAMPESFGGMSQVVDTGEFPWRMNCKLLMRFETTDGTDAFFVCSGSMIDAETVLTAGHCVYATEPDIDDWAKEIYVFPGWDGSGNIFPIPDSVEKYGWARGTSFLAAADYINNDNPDRDCGLVRVTRAVGMLTGWYGWAWGDDCTTVQARVYHNASYPAEACGSPGLHTGKEMYYWSGLVDNCPFNQLRLATEPGCFSAVWGGMSGSGMYYIQDTTRYVHAVASTSDRTYNAYYCKLWEQFVTSMTGTFIPDSRGTTFDLQPLNCEAEPLTLEAGESTTLLKHLAANPTNADPPSATYTFRVYLSSNDYISTSDTLLSTQFFDWDFGPMSSVIINMAPVTIPDDAGGNYWIGVRYDSATDGDSSNNTTNYWDAAPIYVEVPPCTTPPDYDETLEPAAGWQTATPQSLTAGGDCRVYRMYLQAGEQYDFSLCSGDGVGASSDPGDGDLTLYDSAGDQLWYIDGAATCDYDASTLGTVHEGWSPVVSDYYYLKVHEYFADPMAYTLAFRRVCAPPEAPANISATDGTSTTDVTLTWTTSPSVECCVFRDNALLSSWQMETSYTDETAIPGVTHSYQVKARDACGESELSAVETGWRAMDCNINGLPDQLEPDADADGVIDDCDDCPGTVPGSSVDSNGCPPLIPGDFDRDGDVDIDADLLHFQQCAEGPSISLDEPGCANADLDGDLDADQSDFGILQACFSGEDIPGDPLCGPAGP